MTAKLNEQVINYLNENQQKFVVELKEWLAIPSISTLLDYKEKVQDAAHWVQAKIAQLGFPVAELIETDGHPLVYGEWLIDSSQDTILIYGHYDVQPVDPVDQWQSPPFEPTVRNNNIYCRGASDDKGQVYLILAALEGWIKVHSRVPVNIKILLEGEEEAGGLAIEKFVNDNPAKLDCDAVLICDTQMADEGQPAVINSLRGILYTEIAVSGALTDMHSGRFGGIAPNPLHALCLLISSLKGEDGKINIPELESVIPTPTESEKNFWREDPLNVQKNLLESMGVKTFIGENEYPPQERLGLRPTLEVHGIRGGFTGEGAKTVIPAKALAKVSLRLPSTLDPHQVFTWFEKAVLGKAPDGYEVAVNKIHAGKGVTVDSENRFIQTAAEAMEKTYQTPPFFVREGGSIPIAALFDLVLDVPVVFMGFGLPDDSIHAPNEKFNLDQLQKGMLTVVDFLSRLEK